MPSDLNMTQPALFLDPPSPDNRTQQPSPIRETAKTDPLSLAVKAKLETVIEASGAFKLPCLPTMAEQYLKLARGLLKVLGQQPTAAQIQSLETQLTQKLIEGFDRSPRTYLSLSYELVNPERGLAGGIGLSLTLEDAPNTLAALSAATSSRFGRYPDAKAMAVAAELGNASTVPVLDIGAGIGRNSLPLAKRGHAVDAIVSNPQAGKQLQEVAQSRGLAVKLLPSQFLDDESVSGSYALALAPEILPHLRSLDAIGQFFRQISRVLLPGGVLVVGAFVTKGHYRPDAKTQELAQALGCSIVERSQLKALIDALPFTWISDESVVAYESRHLPSEAWVPSENFLAWANGRELFPTLIDPPVELRWLRFQRV